MTKRTPVEWRIVGVYREPADNGQMAIVSLRTLHRVDSAAEPDTYFLRLSPGADRQALRAYLKSARRRIAGPRRREHAASQPGTNSS